MRKYLFLLSVSLFILLAANFSKASDMGVPLGDSPLYEQLTLTSGDLLKEMVVLPDHEYDQQEAANIIKSLDLLPRSILAAAHRHHIKMVLFDGNLTDLESASHLKGKTPRGYPENAVWDDLPGMGGTERVFVKIGCSGKGNGHGSVNLEYHELAHSLLRLVYQDEQTEDLVSQSWEKEAPVLFPGESYFLNYKEEFFAESFAFYFYSPQTRGELKRSAPLMYEFLDSL
jgi:hypothetical protein